MLLFETTFSFDEVLTIRPDEDNTVSYKLIDLAWDRWAAIQPATFKQHEENACATIKNGLDGYTVTIETIVTCDRETYMLYGRYLE